MTLSAARRTSLVLASALATLAWGASLSAPALVGAPLGVAHAQEAEDLEDLAPEDEDDGDDEGLGQLEDLAPQDEEDDGTDDDGTDDDGFENDLGDDDLGDDGDADATPVGGVDAGFGGLAADGSDALPVTIAITTLLLALGAGAWVQSRRTSTDPA